MRVSFCALILVSFIFREQFRPTIAKNTNNHSTPQEIEANQDGKIFKNCEEIKRSGDLTSGVRTVFPIEDFSIFSLDVYCDQNTDDGGWTVVQNRDAVPVRENFYRSWNEYVQGFGNLTNEFWLGLENIHALTSSKEMELRVDLEDFEGEKRWAKYGTFHVGDSSTKYVLSIDNFHGDAGDGFTPDSASVNLNEMKFSTYDQDNDLKPSGSCAKIFRGAWWFNDCHRSHLNGLFDDGIVWLPFHEGYKSLKKASMKIRPILTKEIIIKEKKKSSSTTLKPDKMFSKNCAERKLHGDSVSGVQVVYPDTNDAKRYTVVFCDQTMDEGGWTVIQKRDDVAERENFTRSWQEYVQGFGDLNGEFWLGLDHIRALTSSAQMELRVDIEDWLGEKRWAKYGIFHVGDAASKFVLTIGNYSGDAGNGMTYSVDKDYNLNGMKFTTDDQDNDLNPSGNCAQDRRGGWWFNYCSLAHLNGYPHRGEHTGKYGEGITWEPFRGFKYSHKKASMKIRPVSRGF